MQKAFFFRLGTADVRRHLEHGPHHDLVAPRGGERPVVPVELRRVLREERLERRLAGDVHSVVLRRDVLQNWNGWGKLDFRFKYIRMQWLNDL